MQENEEIVREYRERGHLVEVDTGKGTEESWAKVYDRLEKGVKWTDIIKSLIKSSSYLYFPLSFKEA